MPIRRCAFPTVRKGPGVYLTNQKEAFNAAYVSSMAAHAGLKTAKADIDDDSAWTHDYRGAMGGVGRTELGNCPLALAVKSFGDERASHRLAFQRTLGLHNLGTNPMPSQNARAMADPTQISADYGHIDTALKGQWNSFVALEAAILAFEPLPLSEFETARKGWLDHLKQLNPNSDEASLRIIVDGQVSVMASERVQFSNQFGSSLMTSHITVALLSHALCEALINAVLAVGLVRHDQHEVLPMLERSDIKEKWRVAPKVFWPEYELDTSAALYATLNELTRRRNALVHYKVDVHVGEKKLIKGSRLEALTVKQHLAWTRRFFSLPYDLVEHVFRVGRRDGFPVYLSRDAIPVAAEHVHRPGRAREDLTK